MKKWFAFGAGFLAGCVLLTAVPAVSATVKKFILSEAVYPVLVDGAEYVNTEKPFLNHEGTTYVPLRAVGELLDTEVRWNDAAKRVEIGSNQGALENHAYRKISVSGSNGSYKVIGEARVFEAVMNYSVSDGHNYLLQENLMLGEGAPAWSSFTLNIQIPSEKLPVNGTLTLELFEYSAKDGNPTNVLIVPLESFP